MNYRKRYRCMFNANTGDEANSIYAKEEGGCYGNGRNGNYNASRANSYLRCIGRILERLSSYRSNILLTCPDDARLSESIVRYQMWGDYTLKAFPEPSPTIIS